MAHRGQGVDGQVITAAVVGILTLTAVLAGHAAAAAQGRDQGRDEGRRRP